MANTQQNPGATTNTFTKGMVKDYSEMYVGEGLWTHARNAVNNSHEGQLGVIGNEPANLFCVTLPYSLIGCIHLLDDQWAIFTTDDADSEIGIFDESACSYKKVINDPALGFNRSHLITGVFRKRFDCERLVYWDDGLNPSRFMDIDNPPLQYTESIVNGCIIKTYTKRLDTEQIRLAPLVQQPCLTLSKGTGSGTLANGSYQVCLGYTINENRVTDYIGLSNVQSLFTHENLTGSLDLKITNMDSHFDEFELVVISTVNNQSVAKRLGYYYTTQGTIHIDAILPDLFTVPINLIPLRTEPIEKTDAMYSVNNYLLRVGTYSKYQFNYQQQANKIITKWAAVQYPETYYYKGGHNVGYLRDEQYAFFIRWVYNTGERSSSFHIPGRQATAAELVNVYAGDAFETIESINNIPQTRQLWQVQNTAGVDDLNSYTLSDGGVVLAKGHMGYWESTEIYPADRPDIWGPLCGQPIRHHKMPDVTIPGGELLNQYNSVNNTVVILGVEFDNISVPVDENGNPISSIVGYEILRGSREGEKSIIAKGMFNNMRQYDIPNNPLVKGLYQNYPYNDLRPDYLLTSDANIGTVGHADVNLGSPLTSYKKNYLSFHSPETNFSKPYLSGEEVKIYQELSGTAQGMFSQPYKHPKFKMLSNFSSQLASTIGTISVIGDFLGSIAQDFNLTLKGTEALPFDKKLTLTKIPNFPLTFGGGASFLGIGGSVTGSIPNPVIVAENIAIGAYNVAVAIAMSYIEAESTGEQLFNIIQALVPRIQFGLQYDSHGFYNNARTNVAGNRRKRIEKSAYVGGNLQSFDTDYHVNNIYRSNFVVIKTEEDIADPTVVDNSRFRISEKGGNINTVVSSTISGYYGAIKVSFPSQYGQLESIRQVPTGSCVFPIGTDVLYKSDVIFGGDTYVGRYTEKNAFTFFNSWPVGEPDEYEIDYRNYTNIPYPRFWLNSSKTVFSLFKNASLQRHLDDRESSLFYVSKGHIYLFFNGVRDFYVESEINLAQRDWEDDLSKRHYDPNEYTDYTSLFRSDIVKSGNFCKYDYSLSVSKLFTNFASWGTLYPRDYNPATAASCYVYRPNRVIYSLPQEQELKKDNWRIFLTNNYKDFISPITAVKKVNKTGALFMMEYQSPFQFIGVEQLQTDAGTKITVGDGGLFNQALQNIVNSDESYEYGSCQNKYAVAATTHGIFWVSQNQGKIFQYSGGLNEISRDGMKWWFAKYLPSQLLKQFSDYPLYDNPVKGVGVQMIYDNTDEVIYITKKDYKPIVSDLQLEGEKFYRVINGHKTYFELTDTSVFEPAHWTLSYDPKNKVWLSFHDWIPSFLIPGKAHFMSVNTNSIWKHNVRCDQYCNFYGKDYPFEVEFVSSTGQAVNSMRNIEYMLEVYKYYNDCRDKFHLLEENFDQAMIYNSEQVSGLLELVMKAKNNPLDGLTYPKINASSISINYSKIEQKYRFNQFWDITKDRGQYTGNELPMFVTAANGYQYQVNPSYIDYNKHILERKKFRHNLNKVWLRKMVSGSHKFLFKLSNEKLQSSYR